MSKVPAELLEDVRSLLEKPELYSDVISALRGSWRGCRSLASKRIWRVREWPLKDALERLGFHFRSRPHGAGHAWYIWTAPFDEVTDFHGRAHAVRP